MGARTDPGDELRAELRTKLAREPLPKWRSPESSDRSTSWFRIGSHAVRSKKVFALRGYATSRAHELRGEYCEIEMNLESLFAHYSEQDWFDLQSAVQAISILDASRTELEKPEPLSDIVDQDLGRARRLMVWLTPPNWLQAQASAIRTRLASFNHPEARAFVIDAVSGDELRFQLDEAIGLTNRLLRSQAINNGLQLRRLEMVRNLGFLTVAALFLFAPVLVDGRSLAAWANGPMEGTPTWVLAYITTAAIALVGATGAALSGLLQARDVPVTSEDYQVRGLQVVLRMVVGAGVAVMLYFLLSWQVLPAMAVSNPGTYLLVAFLAGFSERYFLGLLSLRKEEQGMPQAPMTPIAPPPKTEAVETTRDATVKE